MFVGHYSASLAAKAAEPRAPLWSYFIASQLLDVGWSILVALGIEKVRVDPMLPGSVFDLYFRPKSDVNLQRSYHSGLTSRV